MRDLFTFFRLPACLPACLVSCRAQRQEISSLRQALAETQDVMLKGKQTYNSVMHTKDLQIAQVGGSQGRALEHAALRLPVLQGGAGLQWLGLGQNLEVKQHPSSQPTVPALTSPCTV